MDRISLEQLEEMQKELFRQQCDLDIQKAMVKHFIKKEKAEQLILSGVSQRSEPLVCKECNGRIDKLDAWCKHCGEVIY
jgi:phosphopantothenoylcysteine synthetase/decarboxylase